MAPLNLSTELLSHFVSPALDDRVVRHPLNGAIRPIQCHRNLGGLLEQIVQLFPQPQGIAVHGQSPSDEFCVSPTNQTRPVYHGNPRFSY